MSLFGFLRADSGSRFKRNFIQVVGANVLAQLLPILVAPLLSRLYSPSDFGVLGVFSSLVAIQASFVTWRLDWQVPNAKYGIQAAGMILLGVFFMVPLSVLSLIFLSLTKDYFEFGRSLQEIGQLVLFLPLAVIGGGLVQLLQAWFVFSGDLTHMARARILQGIVSTTTSVACGVANMGVVGLIGSLIVGTWFANGAMLMHLQQLRRDCSRLTVRILKACWLRFGKVASLTVLVSIINTCSSSILPLTLAHYYSMTEVGWFALVYRIVVSPVGVVTSAMDRSFWVEASQLAKKDVVALRTLYIKTTKKLILGSVPVMLACVAGRFLVGDIFGSEWEEAGLVFYAVIPLVFGIMVGSPTNFLLVFNVQHYQIVADLVRIVLLLASVAYSGTHGYSIYVSVFLASMAFLVGYIVHFIIQILLLRNRIASRGSA